MRDWWFELSPRYVLRAPVASAGKGKGATAGLFKDVFILQVGIMQGEDISNVSPPQKSCETHTYKLGCFITHFWLFYFTLIVDL
jgi:hypothetical protein